MGRTPRRLLLILAGLAVVAVAAALLLPVLVDANRYREVIAARAAATLGRPVSLGEVRLTVLPRLGVRARDVAIGATAAEGGGDLLTAQGLQVGARLLPLLRGRLEITSVSLQAPSLVLARAADGTWNVQQIMVPPSTPQEEPGPGAGGEFSLDRLRVRDGRVVVRDRALRPGQELELTVADLSLDLKDLAPGRAAFVDLAATLPGDEPVRLTLEGKAGPLAAQGDEPFQVSGEISMENLDPTRYASWIEALAGPGWAPPDGLLGPRSFTVSLAMAATLHRDPGGDLAPQQVTVSRAEVAGLEVRLHRGRGGWEMPAALATGEARDDDGASLSLRDLTARDVRLRLTDTTGGAARELVVDGLALRLDRLPWAAPATLSLEAAIQGEGGKGRVDVRGEVGPLSEQPSRQGATSPFPVDLEVKLQRLPLGAVGPFLEEVLSVVPSAGRLDLETTLEGDLGHRFQAAGRFALAGARIALPASGGAARTTTLDLESRYDVAADGAGAVLDFRALEIRAGGDTLKLEGRLDRSGALPLVDLRLHPARVGADGLAGLLALAGVELPVTFSASRPVEIQARVQGEVGGETYPSVDARLGLAGFTFRHASMTGPMEDVRATIRVQGESVEIKDFAGRLGDSDVAGELVLTGFARPRVRFALQSGHADFWELMSFVAADETAAGPATGGGGGGSFLDGVEATGTLAIARGSFQSLAFTDLATTLGLAGQTITLRPFRMALYQGTFDGALSLDLGADPPAFTLVSEVKDVDSARLLADTLAAGELLSGRFSGSLEARGSGTDYESIVRALRGGGRVQVVDGHLGGLDVLQTLSKASGVFGEQTLKSLSRKLQEQGTDFSRLAGSLSLAGPRMQVDDMLLESPDLRLQGGGGVDLLTGAMEGVFQVIFSRALSQSMREEKSRAASVFWDGKREQVNLPLTLSGLYSAPTPGIDWGAAAEQMVERKVQEKLKEKLGSRLGDLLGGRQEAPPAAGDSPPSAPSPAPPAGDPTPATAGEARASSLAPQTATAEEGTAPAGGPVVEFTRVGWGGSILARDLELEGVVRGTHLAGAHLEVSDASGRRIDSRQLDAVATYLAGGADPATQAAIPWRHEVDGKELLLARFPLTVTVTVSTTDGAATRATREVRK